MKELVDNHDFDLFYNLVLQRFRYQMDWKVVPKFQAIPNEIVAFRKKWKDDSSKTWSKCK